MLTLVSTLDMIGASGFFNEFLFDLMGEKDNTQFLSDLICFSFSLFAETSILDCCLLNQNCGDCVCVVGLLVVSS